jgi:hypothetical protein
MLIEMVLEIVTALPGNLQPLLVRKIDFQSLPVRWGGS